MFYDVTSHDPAFVLIQFGMNDCNRWDTDKGATRVSKKAFVANIEEIVEKCILSGSKHCFLNTNHPSLKDKVKKNDLSYDKDNSDYSGLIRETFSNLKKSNLPVSLFDIDLQWQTYFEKNRSEYLEDFLLEDGIHLSEKGHEFYKKLIIPNILKKVKQISIGF